MTGDLRLGIGLGYWQGEPRDETDTVVAAEALGYDSVWIGEAYGSDALTPLDLVSPRAPRASSSAPRSSSSTRARRPTRR